ncbi:beta-lactamase hydrolase domain-containing protein [Arenimonas sp. MALMAid1274]|uniref:beta-lactamase hydrolase domain-containing protein n=1 Tax=Arenimonas sp. MALMAid1274 TaxID=3411630 RepID=UPI003B9EA676
MPALPLADIPGFRRLEPTLASAGQPEPADWPRLVAAGFRGVLNLRPGTEQPGFDEAEAVAALGMVYAALPVATSADLTPALVARFDELLQRLPSPCLVHCASGNRVGALFALREAWLRGAGVEAAVEKGRQAGLSGLEAPVRALLSR